MSDVREFGATGDGATDDTEAIQHALQVGRGVLAFPKGTYRITRSLTVELERTGFAGIRGENGTARLLMDATGPALRLVGTHGGSAFPASITPGVWDRQRFPVVSGLEILGRHDEADGIELVRTMQTTLQNVSIRRCRFGLHLVERNRNVLLSGSHIYDCHDSGVFFDRCNLHQVIISGNHISYCKRAGIRQLGGDVHNVHITGNDIEYNSGLSEASGEILLECESDQTSEFTIASNTIQATRESPGANIFIRGPEGTPPVRAVLIAISGNVIGSRGEHNIRIENAGRVAITGNTIYDGIQRNVVLRNLRNFVLSGNTIGTRPVYWNSTAVDGVTLEKCVHGTVQGNLFDDCHPGPDAPGGSLVLADCDGVNVSGNQIGAPHASGICLIRSRRCLVQGNAITLEHERAVIDGIVADADSAECRVENNAVW